MSYSDNPGTSMLGGIFRRIIDRLSELSQLSWGIIYAAVFGILGMFLIDPTPPLRRVIDAPEYVWPKGCPKLPLQVYPPEALNPKYRGVVSRMQIWPSNEKIPCACADAAYEIKDYRKKYGLLKVGRGPAKFYRIGPDAAQISPSNKKAGICYKDHVYVNFFQEKNQQNDISVLRCQFTKCTKYVRDAQ